MGYSLGFSDEKRKLGLSLLAMWTKWHGKAACGERKLDPCVRPCDAAWAMVSARGTSPVPNHAPPPEVCTYWNVHAVCAHCQHTPHTDWPMLGSGLEGPARRVTAVPLHGAHAAPHSLARAQLPGRSLPRSQVGSLLHACAHALAHLLVSVDDLRHISPHAQMARTLAPCSA